LAEGFLYSPERVRDLRCSLRCNNNRSTDRFECCFQLTLHDGSDSRIHVRVEVVMAWECTSCVIAHRPGPELCKSYIVDRCHLGKSVSLSKKCRTGLNSLPIDGGSRYTRDFNFLKVQLFFFSVMFFFLASQIPINGAGKGRV
jgi:hypothetical protein